MAAAKQFVEQDLRGARFIECDLSEVVMRGVEVTGMEIDAPWLGVGSGLKVNGVDVTAFVEGELDRRFPGRDMRRVTSAQGLREAWDALDLAWDVAVERAASLPEGSVDVRIEDEWSFAETLRHLVRATDVWLGKGVLGIDESKSHPLGLRHGAGAQQVLPLTEVLAARASRATMVRDYLATVTDDVLDEDRRNPHDPDEAETVRSCVHVILQEGWEHLRYASRDLDEVESRSVPASCF